MVKKKKKSALGEPTAEQLYIPPLTSLNSEVRDAKQPGILPTAFDVSCALQLQLSFHVIGLQFLETVS